MREERNGCDRGDEAEVRAVLKVPGEPDRNVVVQMPDWAVPVSKGKRK